MDSSSLFLTANADTVYYLSVVDLSKGPMVIEQPPKGLGTINDMWFSWIIDIGFPGPDRGEGGKYLIVPPGYDGPLPEGGFYVAHSKTNRVLYAARAFLDDNDPKPAVASDQEVDQDLSLHAGRCRNQHRDGARRQGPARSQSAIPETKFVEASGKSFNTIPPSDFRFFEMINENVQQEPADSYDVELAGQLAAIGIVKGKPFEPDARMRKILADAAAVGTRRGRVLNWRYTEAHPDWAYYPGSSWGNMLFEGGYDFETPPPMFTTEGMFKPFPPTGARTLDSRTAFYFAYTLDSPGMIMRIPGVGSQYLMGFLDADKNPFDGAQDLQGDAAAGHSRAGVLVVHGVRQPVALDARHAAAVSARRQPELSLARGEGESRRLDDDLLRAQAAEGRGARQLDPDRCPARVGSRSCACTARSSRSSPRNGDRRRSNW